MEGVSPQRDICARSVLVALYLPGFATYEVAKKRWFTVLQLVQQHQPDFKSVTSLLESASLYDESFVLRQEGVLERALDLIEAGKVLTSACPHYPERWLQKLGDSAPPALWTSQRLYSQNSVTVVGSRLITEQESALASSVSQAVVKSGRSILTGGAMGVDQQALNASLERGCPATVILPYGLNQLNEKMDENVTYLSSCPPDEVFSARRAHQRNVLLYAGSSVSFSIAPRYQKGGTWTGSLHAIRQKLTSLAVVPLDGELSQASLALNKLGALVAPSYEMKDQGDYIELVRTFILDPIHDQPTYCQPCLFGAMPLRETSSLYAG